MLATMALQCILAITVIMVITAVTAITEVTVIMEVMVAAVTDPYHFEQVIGAAAPKAVNTTISLRT
jgi:hypothetical protein